MGPQSFQDRVLFGEVLTHLSRDNCGTWGRRQVSVLRKHMRLKEAVLQCRMSSSRALRGVNSGVCVRSVPARALVSVNIPVYGHYVSAAAIQRWRQRSARKAKALARAA